MQKLNAWWAGMGFLALISTFPGTARAALHRPPSFPVGGSRAVFVDFQDADYRIVYDLKAKVAYSDAKIRFVQLEAGMPVFDVQAEPTQVLLDGKPVPQKLVRDPHLSTAMRVVAVATPAGRHELRIRTPLVFGVRFDANSVRSGFFMSDLRERGYLERYLPTNLDYDQYRIRFQIVIPYLQGDQDIFASGMVRRLSPNSWEVIYPPQYNASALYFHTAPKGAFQITRGEYRSIDGRAIPITTYSSDGLQAVKEIIAVLAELEATYGPWPHPAVLAHLTADGGGMEYCGATITSMRALAHELTHSYFARGVMPAGGNAGWIDEAIASWRDKSYPSLSTIEFEPNIMAGRSPYVRMTDDLAYTEGAAFIAHLDWLLRDTGGMKPFLAAFVKNRLFQPYTTPEFASLLEAFAKQPLTPLFRKYLTGGTGFRRRGIAPNPYHRAITEADVQRLI